MENKILRIELEAVKVANILVDLGGLKSYMSNFLALKNHERETDEILSVQGIYGSNEVHVILLIDEEKPQHEELAKCIDFAGQFGKVVNSEVEDAYILEKQLNDINYELDYKELYFYR